MFSDSVKRDMKRNHLIKSVPFLGLIMFLLAAAVCLQAVMAQAVECVNIGFSRSILGEINENDTLAAVKLWSTKLVITDDSPVNVEAKIYEDTREIETALKQGMVDLINLSTLEFSNLQYLLDQEQFIFAVIGSTITEEYLLLVRKESRFADIKDLKGSVLKFPKNDRTAVSSIWLDIKLAEAGLPAAEHFFNQIVAVNKVSAALLPVFFGNADACLVTRKGFETMAELNPQISHQLKILAASKAYVPGFLGFRRNFQSRIRGVIVNNLKTWHKSSAGYQILTIFQMDDLVLKPFETLGPTMQLIKEHRRLFDADTGTSLPESKAKAGRF